jgi:hypothetical protein
VKVEEGQVSALINISRSESCQRMHSSETQCFYTVDGCLQLIDINDQKTVLYDICENVEIQIDLIEVLQFLLIVEKVSQLMILDMSY